MTRPKHQRRGFTLLEVMIGLALLGLGLTVLIKSAANSIFNARQSHMMGVTTDLARAKMYEIEEILLKDGFSETDLDEEDKTFEEEGWPSVRYSYKVEVVELPSMEELARLAAGSGSGSGDTGMLGGLFGGGGDGGGSGSGSGAGDALGASFIQGQFSMFQQILKVSVRRVTLTLNWQVMGSDRDMRVVAFFTDSAAMDKVLNGLGANDLPGPGSDPK